MCLAVPMKIIAVEGEKARVSLGGLAQEIDVRFLSNPRPGEYVIVHAGFAIERLDPGEAEKTLALFREMELLDKANG
ncbi:MAG: HypC/HybG/HupF family hydrogenase formation chaperone [Candidatus Euphemobacter frigidus]|nr:HypC/HybG/HupF family hydrogenase formation chaperone [Candidatus Euphemobacter frigidus]MDP8276756.1 HypC/HybG/HupF family hydrogenase formation chaperone [Candidatus Euphemobacter frigidus]